MLQDRKRRLFEILEIAPEGDLASRTFDVFIITLVFLNVIAGILETVEQLSVQYGVFFRLFETASIAIFTLEYLLRLWSCTVDARFRAPLTGRIRYALTPLALIDFLAIAPFYLPMLLSLDLRFMRILRVLRIFVVFKLGRYSETLQSFGNVVRAKKEEMVMSLVIVMMLLIISSSLMYFAEHEAQPEAFASIPAAMWWGIVTLTTVGYGDVYPVTSIGRVVGALIAILGIGMVALPTGILASGFVEELQKGRGTRQVCPHCGKDMAELPDAAPDRS
ncbi:MAG: ion transporter [Chloroflexi bacterium]|nr:ion transporter [Chloroflexota bacterium]